MTPPKTPLQVVIAENDPMIPLLEDRARRRFKDRDPKKLRKRLPRLARALLSERLGELVQRGDPFELPG
jgi:hypothetical protein